MIGRAAALAALVLACGPSRADMIDTEGMAPWEVCGLCHGLDGNSATARFPRIAGQKAAYVEKQIHDVRAGRRTNDGGQMRSIVHEVDAGDIPAIAAHFAAQTVAPAPAELAPTGPEGDLLAAALWREGRAGVPACARCHGAEAVPPAGLIPPHLSAQHAAYLAKQLDDFAQGRRANDPGGVMQAVAAALTEDEVAALSAWLAATPRRPQ